MLFSNDIWKLILEVHHFKEKAARPTDQPENIALWVAHLQTTRIFETSIHWTSTHLVERCDSWSPFLGRGRQWATGTEPMRFGTCTSSSSKQDSLDPYPEPWQLWQQRGKYQPQQHQEPAKLVNNFGSGPPLLTQQLCNCVAGNPFLWGFEASKSGRLYPSDTSLMALGDLVSLLELFWVVCRHKVPVQLSKPGACTNKTWEIPRTRVVTDIAHRNAAETSGRQQIQHVLNVSEPCKAQISTRGWFLWDLDGRFRITNCQKRWKE